MEEQTDSYDPTWESLDTHETPKWYNGAKLGIFIHWGVYSVPAWAPPGNYAEWYPYYMHQSGHETNEYHRDRYGEDFEYSEFIDQWNAERWDPVAWAEFFEDVGARYVVLTGEHHDGFPLWDSHYTAYNAATAGPERDIVGELAAAVRDRGLRFSASYHANMNYYQPGFEGQFGHPDYHPGPDGTDKEAYPGSEYVDFMNAKHRELIRRYRPDLLWFDLPKADSEHLRAKELVAEYYNTAAEEWEKEVAVNDRSGTDAHRAHADIYTPEYAHFEEITEQKWEACRGIGASFGYNRNEDPNDILSASELVAMFVEIVSKNGNLLINVGPKADGTIPERQREPLSGLGGWLDVNGEAIFDTTYWAVAEDRDSERPVYYTWSDDVLYAICLDWPDPTLELRIGDYADLDAVDDVSLLGSDSSLAWETNDPNLAITPDDRPSGDHTEYAYAFRIENVSNPRQ